MKNLVRQQAAQFASQLIIPSSHPSQKSQLDRNVQLQPQQQYQQLQQQQLQQQHQQQQQQPQQKDTVKQRKKTEPKKKSGKCEKQNIETSTKVNINISSAGGPIQRDYTPLLSIESLENGRQAFASFTNSIAQLTKSQQKDAFEELLDQFDKLLDLRYGNSFRSGFFNDTSNIAKHSNQGQHETQSSVHLMICIVR